jgi:hypothetical protein
MSLFLNIFLFCCFPQKNTLEFGGSYNLCNCIKFFVEFLAEWEYTVVAEGNQEGFWFLPEKKRKKANGGSSPT